jgi:hypothetical protein
VTRPALGGLVALSAALACAACGDVEVEDDRSAEDAVQSASATRLGELAYDALGTLHGRFEGPPLWVSNNPEDVHGFGLLSSTRPPGPALAPRTSERGAPYADLRTVGPRAWGQPGCADGEVKELDLYLAHILSRDHLRGRRRVSVIAEASRQPVTVRWSAEVGTTGWSDLFGMKTTRADWLGARIARFRLDHSRPGATLDRAIAIAPGALATLATVDASSLVEGAVHLEASGGCVAVHVVAHSGDVDTPLPTYAMGDVKWPGWSGGGSFGRAAGLYEGSRWTGSGQGTLTKERSALGWRLFDAEGSPNALAHHADSARVLFGGYGVVYEAKLALDNRTSSCVAAEVAFTSYAALAPGPGASALGGRRTPSFRSLDSTDPAKHPSMLWNGPIRFRERRSGGEWAEARAHVILKPPSNGSRRDSLAVPGEVSQPLLRWKMNAGERREVVVQIPVPGYVVAPAAITVESAPCGR